MREANNPVSEQQFLSQSRMDPIIWHQAVIRKSIGERRM